MEVVEVKSSVIAKIAYDNGILYIKFKENGWFKYPRVPKNIFERFIKAPSKGEFLNKDFNILFGKFLL